MPAACVAYLLPFWPIHWPASAVHTSTSSSPMAGKAFAYSLDCQSRIIANYSFKVSLSKSGITKTGPDLLGWIGMNGIYFGGSFNYEGTFTERGVVLNLTDGYINYTAIERTMGGRIDHTTTNLMSAMMCVLRVGAVGPGATPPSNTVIN
jgi:hypothetical protein